MDTFIDNFFLFLKRGLIALMLIMFGTVMVYVPHNWNEVPQAEAGAAGGGSTLPGQLVALVQQTYNAVKNTITAIANKAQAVFAQDLWLKETILDGVFWSLAKKFVSSMAQSTIDWINGGFEGKPAFVSDLKQFLLDETDEFIGEFISNLGAIGSFICDPFKLNVQIAVQLQHQETRTNQASACTLTGALANLDDFIKGTQGSFSEQGGWEAWFDITSEPKKYTPFGAIVSTQAVAEVRLSNLKEEETAKIGWAKGFFSIRDDCPTVTSASGIQETRCSIITPGSAIASALDNNLDSGRQALLEADETNEVLGALIGGLAQQAFTGAAGLLGLSDRGADTDGDGIGDTYDSYLDKLGIEDGVLSATSSLAQMEEALAIQIAMSSSSSAYEPLLLALSTNYITSEEVRTDSEKASIDAQEIIIEATGYQTSIQALITEYETELAKDKPDNNKITDILIRYNQLDKFSEFDIEIKESEWDSILARE